MTPTCPACEEESKPDQGFLSFIPAPARWALEGVGIKTLVLLSRWTESEILTLHGIGPSTIPKLRRALASEGYAFRKN